MKQTVEWHTKRTLALTTTLERELVELEDSLKRVQGITDRLSLAQDQLKEAKRRGIYAYDDEKFCVPRKAKT